MKNFIVGFIVVVVAVLALNSDFVRKKNTKTFVVTGDTNVSKHPELAKYVTQEEIDEFALMYWDIDYNSNPKNIFKEPQVDIDLKLLLKSKQTDKILKFISDNNLSIDHAMNSGVTPIMYSAFWNDTNTTQELINLGADIHKKDRFGFSAMSYAVGNISLDTIKLLFDNGIQMSEFADHVNGYNNYLGYHSGDGYGVLKEEGKKPDDINTDRLVIIGDNLTQVLLPEPPILKGNNGHPKGRANALEYAVKNNFIDLANCF